MATKSSTKTAKKATKQDLLYIMSPQCGWCKKADPVVDELIKDGAKITILDVTNPEDQQRANEVKSKFSAQCGTPLFIDGESGNMKCGFAEKDVLQKWVNGEEIPKPPQPKSPPPPPPTDFADTVQVENFKTAYEKWAKENDHLPKILPVDQVLQRMEMAQKQRQQQMLLMQQQQQMAQQQLAQQQMAQQQLAQQQLAQQQLAQKMDKNDKDEELDDLDLIEKIKKKVLQNYKEILVVFFLSIILNISQVDKLLLFNEKIFKTNDNPNVFFNLFKAIIITVVFISVKILL